MVKDFPIGFCRGLLSKDPTPGQTLLEALGTRFHYEIYVGYNGRIWVNAEKAADVIFILSALEKLIEMHSTEDSVEFIMKTLIPS
jgi:exosome complex RNA-binding protein Rrp4